MTTSDFPAMTPELLAHLSAVLGCPIPEELLAPPAASYQSMFLAVDRLRHLPLAERVPAGAYVPEHWD